MTLRPTPTDLWESNFGTEPAFRLGVEEELLLVGPDNELVDRGAEVVQDAHPDEGDVDRELFKAMVESRSEISTNAREVIGTLREVRRELAASGAATSTRTAARTDPSSTCVYTFSVVSIFACPITCATILPGTPFSCAHVA